jgi:hypothetical protein
MWRKQSPFAPAKAAPLLRKRKATVATCERLPVAQQVELARNGRIGNRRTELFRCHDLRLGGGSLPRDH